MTNTLFPHPGSRERYGLLGRGCAKSPSPEIHQTFWPKDGVLRSYTIYDSASPKDMIDDMRRDPTFRGLNVTIPFKQEIIPLLDEIDVSAQVVGAVNTVARIDDGSSCILRGYNTDLEGFDLYLQRYECTEHDRAMVIGTGGAALAVMAALARHGAQAVVLSRDIKKGITYDALTDDTARSCRFWIDCTPLGSALFPGKKPDLPYHLLTPDHILIDLVYAPEITPFMQEGLDCGAGVANGLTMLHGQARAAWDIWYRSTKDHL